MEMTKMPWSCTFVFLTTRFLTLLLKLFCIITLMIINWMKSILAKIAKYVSLKEHSRFLTKRHPLIYLDYFDNTCPNSRSGLVSMWFLQITGWNLPKLWLYKERALGNQLLMLFWFLLELLLQRCCHNPGTYKKRKMRRVRWEGEKCGCRAIKERNKSILLLYLLSFLSWSGLGFLHVCKAMFMTYFFLDIPSRLV